MYVLIGIVGVIGTIVFLFGTMFSIAEKESKKLIIGCIFGLAVSIASAGYGIGNDVRETQTQYDIQKQIVYHGCMYQRLTKVDKKKKPYPRWETFETFCTAASNMKQVRDEYKRKSN
jgi:hypothetical protein